MANVIVKSNHLTYGGKQYFRGGAEDVLLGAYGEIKRPVTKQMVNRVPSEAPMMAARRSSRSGLW